MGYGLLGVSEVGPAEYPLIRMLHHSVFGGLQEIAALRGGSADLLTLIAHLEGNPVRYLVGSGGADGAEFVVESIAVLPGYQNQGLGTRMLELGGAARTLARLSTDDLEGPRAVPPRCREAGSPVRPDRGGEWRIHSSASRPATVSVKR